MANSPGWRSSDVIPLWVDTGDRWVSGRQVGLVVLALQTECVVVGSSLPGRDLWPQMERRTMVEQVQLEVV